MASADDKSMASADHKSMGSADDKASAGGRQVKLMASPCQRSMLCTVHLLHHRGWPGSADGGPLPVLTVEDGIPKQRSCHGNPLRSLSCWVVTCHFTDVVHSSFIASSTMASADSGQWHRKATVLCIHSHGSLALTGSFALILVAATEGRVFSEGSSVL
jgi:hypothetical protein